jgi:hypothetical protein
VSTQSTENSLRTGRTNPGRVRPPAPSPIRHSQPLPVGRLILDATQVKVLSVEREFADYASSEYGGRSFSPRWMDPDDPEPGAFIDLVGDDVAREARTNARRWLPCDSRW